MRIYPFQGVRYSGSEPGRHAAPPYDQINDALRDQLHADELSFAQLTRPAATNRSEGHARAARTHADWLASGVIAVDDEPGLYPYRIELAGGGERFGLVALVGIEPPDSLVIRRHEHTISKTVDERLELVRTLRADLGPVLLLSEDDGSLDELLAADCADAPLAEHQDADGNRHFLFRVADSARLEAYRQALREAPGLIADGHHRYKVGGLFAREAGAKPGEAAAAKLAVVTSLRSRALTIDPIHRALPVPVPLAGSQLEGLVLEERPTEASSGSALAAAVAEAGQPALGILDAQGGRIFRLEAGHGPNDLPAAASELSVVLLHHALLPRLGFAPGAATDGTILYRSDPDELWSLIRQATDGNAGIADGAPRTGIFLPPMSAEGFAGAIADGDILPPKSTRFLPKVVSGLVWSTHESRLG